MMNSEDQDHIPLSVEDAGRSTPQLVLCWRSCLEMIYKVPMPVWNRISIISSVIGVSADPLFFYVPFIDEDNKCIGIDNKLRIAVLILRSLTDITTLVYIMHHIHKTLKHVMSTGWNWKTKKLIQKSFFQIAVVLPIPQVLVLVLFFRSRGDKYIQDRMMMNSFLLFQYIPRLYQIYLLSKQLNKQVGILIKGVFYLFLYILASHILGAFFYFLSIERLSSCWHHKCRITGGCTTTYHCGDHTSVNITLLTELCPISPSNATMFDFGIFGNSIQSGNLELINVSEKIVYFVWWGLRNLSNFGTNLETSSYLWENCFAILISVTGLLLFLYLIGNVQQCMQWEAEKDDKYQLDMKFKVQKEIIEFWMNDRGVDEKLKKEIMAEVDSISMKNIGAGFDDLFSILSEKRKESLKCFLCMDMLKNVPKLQGMDDFVLRSICRYLEPVIYKDGTSFVKVGEPLDRLILLIDGNMLVYTSDSIHRLVEDGGVYGEQLLSWASSNSNICASLTDLPISKENVKCITKVKGFVIRAEDFSKMAMYRQIRNSTESSLVKEMAFSSISTETSPFSNQPTSTVPTLDVDPTSCKGM